MKDPYKYENTDVLINKCNIKNEADLLKKEIESTYTKFLTLDNVVGKYDYEHLKNMHRHIFGSIYEWAGKERLVPIEKSEKVLNGLSVQYADPSDIRKQATQVIKELHAVKWHQMSLEEQAKILAKYSAALWQVHPFREGNTRTTISFITSYADINGMHMDVDLLKKYSSYVRNALVLSSIGEYSETKHLEKIFKDALERGRQILIQEIENAPHPSLLKNFNPKVLYNSYAKKYIINHTLQSDCDKHIAKDMLLDGHSKDTISSVLAHSPILSKLPFNEKPVQLKKLFSEISKDPALKKVLAKTQELSR